MVKGETKMYESFKLCNPLSKGKKKNNKNNETMDYAQFVSPELWTLCVIIIMRHHNTRGMATCGQEQFLLPTLINF